MGFAGQVFAARVAIGLAIPSPSAFSEAGAAVGKFSSNLYNQLNKNSSENAKKNVINAEKNLQGARGRLAKHLKNQDKVLTQNTAASVNNLQTQYSKLGRMSTISLNRMKEMAKSMPKPIKTRLFKGVSKDMSDADKYLKMLKNFGNMSKSQRKLTIESLNAEQLALKSQINTIAKRTKLGKKKTQAIRDQISLRKEEQQQMIHISNIRTQLETSTGEKTKKLLKEEKKAIDKLTKTKKTLAQITQENAKATEHWGMAVGRAAGQLKQNFSEALRESISVLTAFYYKLQQNTQSLIEFERELINANSVFGVTNDELFKVGNTVVEFGQQFGMEMQNGATGLYQLASAGLTANEAMELLPSTLKLSMAVQGDHNTIAKLTTQTLFGFGMEMSQAAEVTDKFAHAIQRSLIEYEDLSSAVKFALPFFTSTGQSIDQLLGALAVLTNRALEAGIAGRGLRQGLAELAESVGDNTAAFRKMGIEVTNEQGELLQLTEIAANFAKTLEEGVINDTELLTMLIEDLNVRGATAFVHLVQASDEFTAAVEDSANAGGQLDEMVQKQNESIGAQIQILKNNVEAIFMLRDASYEGTEFINAFHEAIVNGVQGLKDLLVVGEEGAMTLTKLGKDIQTVAVEGVQQFVNLLKDLIPLIKDFVKEGGVNVELLKLYFIPLKMIVKGMEMLGPGLMKVVVAMMMMNKLLPIQSIATLYQTKAMLALASATSKVGKSTKVANKAIAATPWGRIALIAIAVGAALYVIVKHSEKAKDALFTVGKILKHIGMAVFAIPLGIARWIKANVDLSEEMFVLGKFFSHFFLMLEMGWKTIVDWVLYFSKMFFLLASPAGPIYMTIKALQKLGLQIEKIPGASRFMNWVEATPKAMGGLVTPRYAAAGAQVSSGQQPYIVGERGPELFVPQQQGKVIPNKDLNTSRVKNMLRDKLLRPLQHARVFSADNLVVGAVTFNKPKLVGAKVGVDTFG